MRWFILCSHFSLKLEPSSQGRLFAFDIVELSDCFWWERENEEKTKFFLHWNFRWIRKLTPRICFLKKLLFFQKRELAAGHGVLLLFAVALLFVPRPSHLEHEVNMFAEWVGLKRKVGGEGEAHKYFLHFFYNLFLRVLYIYKKHILLFNTKE